MSTKIMGQAQASIEQMRAYIKKVNPKAPERYCTGHDKRIYY